MVHEQRVYTAINSLTHVHVNSFPCALCVECLCVCPLLSFVGARAQRRHFEDIHKHLNSNFLETFGVCPSNKSFDAGDAYV